MKIIKYTLFTFVLLLAVGISVKAQIICPVTEQNYTKQSQVDSFPIVYGHCDRIDTTIFIIGSDIVSLDSLYPLKYVHKMDIRLTNIKNVRGLQGLDSAGHITVFKNYILEDIKDFKNLNVCNLS